MRGTHRSVAIALLISWQAAPVSAGEPGLLDPAFNGTGVVEYEVGGEVTSQISKVFVLEDGSVVAVGGANTTADLGWPPPRAGVVVWFAPDGSVQNSGTYEAGVFGCTAWRQFYDGIRLDDGSLIVTGQRQPSCSGTPQYLDVMHIGANGGVVRSFDPGVFHNVGASGHALALQPDGKVVIAGRASTGSGVENRDVALTRHHIADGTLDEAFGDSGEVTFDIDGDWDRLTSVAIRDDGKIIAAGFATTTNGRDFLIIRLQADGALDTDFGIGGIVVFDFEGADDRINDLSLLPDGRIMVAGASTTAGGNRQWTIARYLEDGGLDTSFADDGIALIDPGGFDSSLSAMEIGPDGRIYLAGWLQAVEADLNSRSPVFAVFHPDGTEDPDFGAPATLDFGSEYPVGIAASVAVDPTLEHIAVGGWVGEYDQDSNRESRIAVARMFGIGDAVFSDRFEP
jgi:uncharacterized delta-60 repeat protein